MGFLAKAVGVEAVKETVASGDTVSLEWLQSNGYVSRDWGNFDSYTNRAIGKNGALEASAVYACTKIIGEDASIPPFFFFQRDRRNVEKAKEDWRYGLLHGMANPDMASGEVIQALTSQAAICGDGYADIEYWDQGRRAWLWPRDPATVTVVRDDAPGSRKGTSPRAVRYQLNGERTLKTGRDIFHLRGFSFEGAKGDAILARARRLLGLYLSAQEFAGRNFSNGIHSDLFFKHPGQLGAEGVEGVLDAWRKKQGVEHAGEPAVLQEGMDAIRLPSDMRKQQLHEARMFQLLEVCRIFRIQPHKIAELTRTTFNNVEELQIDHVVNTMGVWFKRWSEAVYRHLLSEDERRRELFFAQHQIEALLRGNFERQANAWATLLVNGVYNINEVRGWLNLNPVEGGDVNRVQMQMQDVTQVAGELVKMLRAA